VLPHAKSTEKKKKKKGRKEKKTKEAFIPVFLFRIPPCEDEMAATDKQLCEGGMN